MGTENEIQAIEIRWPTGRVERFLGAVVGVWNGVICACLQFGSPQSMSSVILYGQPMIHVAFGSLGGWLGFAIWRPVQSPLEAGRHQAKAKPASRAVSWMSGRVAWFRVIVGILDELGVEHPLAREGRRRLAAALY